MIRRGYSLIECMVVILLLVTIGFVSTYSFRWTRHVAVKEALDVLYILILSVSQHAMHRGVPITLLCSLDGIIRSHNLVYQLPFGVHFGTAHHVAGPPAVPVEMITDPITFPHHRVICYPDGIISSGTFYLTDDSRSCTYALTCAVGIMNCVRRYRFEDERWVLLEM